MNIAYSPCPNDTFIFHAWAHGLIPDAPPLQVTYADIDITNHLAARQEGPEVMKVSYAALPWIIEHYRLLPCGGALGRGCGPLLLTKSEAAGNRGSEPTGAELAGKRIAVPSDRSTAYLLFRLWAARHIPGGAKEIIIMPFHQIMPAVQSGEIDAGLVIHEARFTYQNYGLHQLVDLGRWWEEEMGHPIPLGAIIAKRNVPLQPIIEAITGSLEYAWANPDASNAYVAEHAQELSEEVAKSHIALYVNEYSLNLGEDGYRAIETLFGEAMKEKLIPEFDLSLLRN